MTKLHLIYSHKLNINEDSFLNRNFSHFLFHKENVKINIEWFQENNEIYRTKSREERAQDNFEISLFIHNVILIGFPFINAYTCVYQWPNNDIHAMGIANKTALNSMQNRNRNVYTERERKEGKQRRIWNYGVQLYSWKFHIICLNGQTTSGICKHDIRIIQNAE